MKKLYVIPLAVASAIVATAPAANAATAGDFLGSGGFGLSGVTAYFQWCQPEFVQAPVGVGSPGEITFEVQTAAVVTSAAAVSAEVTCVITQDGVTKLTAASGWSRGVAAAEADGSFTTRSNSPLTKCVQVGWFDGNTSYSPWICAPV